MGHSSHGHSSEHHVISFGTHMTVLVVLLILTFITVEASHHDFGTMNIVIAMLIASVKAGIVGLFFMHLKYENPMIWLYVSFPLILLAIMLTGLFIDNPTREIPGKTKVWVPGFVPEHKPAAGGETHH